jgi:Tfp pilus assembly protein PilF
MKKICGIAFAWAAYALLSMAFAQQAVKKPLTSHDKKDWHHYDSLAAVKILNRDTIGALEDYRKALQMNPQNETLEKNYERLSHLYHKAGRSFYDVQP